MSRAKKFIFLITAVLFLVFRVESAETTNLLDAEYALPPGYELEQNQPSLELWQRYGQEIFRNRDAITDRVGPPSFMKWMRKSAKDGRVARDDFDSAGADAVAAILDDSASETAAAILPLENWENFGISVASGIGGFFQSALGNLWTGLLGNTAEKRFEHGSETFSVSEYSWQETLRQSGVRFGIRPWQTDPYVYIGTRIGSWGGLEDLPIAILEQRIGARGLDGGKMQTSLIFPLPQKVRISGSFSLDPLHLYSANEDRLSVSARIERVIGVDRSLKALYVGCRSNRNETTVTAGFFMPW